jgi:putative ABC transport system permease protein
MTRNDAATAAVNVAAVTRRVALVGLFMILLLTAHGMAQSVRERLSEFAVLKTVGYSDAGVIALVFAEALAPAILGAALGLGAAALLSERIPALLPGLGLPEPYLSPAVIGEALTAAALLALLSVVLPARSLKRLYVAAILAGRS